MSKRSTTTTNRDKDVQSPILRVVYSLLAVVHGILAILLGLVMVLYWVVVICLQIAFSPVVLVLHCALRACGRQGFVDKANPDYSLSVTIGFDGFRKAR
jgi:uncharacterized membrane protein